MNKDKFQDKYNEIFQEIKEEKMNWNFEDFLAQTKEKPEDAKIVPLQKKSSKQWLYIAASLVLITGLGIVLKNNFSESTTVKPTEIAQKDSSENTDKPIIAQTTTVKSEDSNFPTTRTVNTEPIKRKKSKYKKSAQYLAENSMKNHDNSAKGDDESIKYNPNFVIINGKPVATEDEAIKYTKNAIDMLGGNINTALEKAEPVKLLTVNF